MTAIDWCGRDTHSVEQSLDTCSAKYAVLCPVCGGSGKLTEEPSRNSTNAVPIVRACHGCEGKGWVTL